MDNSDTKTKSAADIPLTISAEGLQGKQSVRATFRLPNHLIDLLGIVAGQLGLKQKSLFDQLIDDVGILDRVAQNAHEYSPDPEDRRQKTFVISRRSLQVLDMVARSQNIPRDVLVEISIKRLLPVMDAEQEKHKKRAQIFADMESYLRQGEMIRRKACELLGEEDQTAEMLKKIVAVCAEKVAALQAVLEKGQAMEEIENYRKPV